MKKKSRLARNYHFVLAMFLLESALFPIGMASEVGYPGHLNADGWSGVRRSRTHSDSGSDGVYADFHGRHIPDTSRGDRHSWWPGSVPYPWPIPRPDPIPSTLPVPPPPPFPLPPVAVNPDPVPAGSISQYRCFGQSLIGMGVWHGATKTDISSASASAVRVCEMSSGEVCQVLRCEQMSSIDLVQTYNLCVR